MSKTSQALLLEKLSPTLETVEAATDWHIGEPAVRARKCTIYRVSGAHHQLALKVYKPDLVSEAAPRIQYDALRRCNSAALGNPLLRAPAALAFLPEERAVLMEWQTAPTLRSTLWKQAASPGTSLKLIKSAGTWLRAFHELSGIENLPLDGKKLLSKLNSQMNRKPEAVALLERQASFNKAMSRFRELATKCTIQTPHALLHGDFTPTNLLVDNKGIIGMDMWGARHAPIYEDITRMHAYLGVVSPFALRAAPLAPNGPLINAFIQGYGEDLASTSTSPFPLILFYQQLRRWLVYADKRNSHPLSPLAHLQLTKNQRLCMQTHNWLNHCKS